MKQIPWLRTWSFLGLMALGMGSISCGSGAGGGDTPSPNPPTPAITFTTQPAHATHLVDQTATFTVAAMGTPTPSFQWERSSDGSTWSALPGATSATYTFKVQAGDHNAQFRAQASNSTGKLASSAAKLSVNVAPNITTQPQSQNLALGAAASLSVAAAVNGTLSCQWRKDGVNISGKTAATLSWSALTAADAGTYDVVVTSTLNGTVASTPSSQATLTLNDVLLFTTQPLSQTVLVNQVVTLVAVASEHPAYQWERCSDGTTWLPIPGATSATHTFTAHASDHNAQFRAKASKGTEKHASSAAILSVNAAPNLTTQPQSQRLSLGDAASLSVAATANGTLSFQWRKDGVNIPGKTAATLSWSALTAADAGTYDVVVTSTLNGTVASTPSSQATLTLKDVLLFTTQPLSQTVLVNQQIVLLVVATGNPTYQWERSSDGTAWLPIPGATSATYAFTAQASDHNAQFRAQASKGTENHASSAAKLSVNVAPTITTQPQSQSLALGAAASLSVAATANGTLSYQWRKDGVNLPSRTSATLNWSALTVADAGMYDVVVTSTLNGTVASTPSSQATLALKDVPLFTTQPLGQTVLVNQTITLSVMATENPTYQWERSSDGTNWLPIPGATTATHTFTSQASDHNLQFRVQASTRSMTVPSQTANIVVNVVPSFTTQPKSQTRSLGRGVTLSVEATANGTLSYQWRKDGKELQGETAATLTRPSLIDTDAGMYDVVLTSTLNGTTVHATSEKAELKLVPLPSITRFKAARQWLMAGQSTTLDVEYTGGTGTLDHGPGSVVSGRSVPTGVISQATKYILTVTNAAGDSVTAQAPIYGPSRVAMGEGHALALKEDGTVWAWGDNLFGQLGGGTVMDHGSPVKVVGLTDVVAVSAGSNFSLALKEDGTVWAWGDDSNVVPIPGPTSSRRVPAQVNGLSRIVAVCAGTSHALALDSNGEVWAWGDNLNGQLGDGTTISRHAPALIPGLSRVVGVSAGYSHSVALAEDGQVWTWGADYYGQLGRRGTAEEYRTPGRAPDFTGAVAIVAAQYATIALKANGQVWAWGDYFDDLLGNGTHKTQGAPAQVELLTDVVAMSAHGTYYLALKADGTLWNWGRPQKYMFDTLSPRVLPIRLEGVPEVSSMVAGPDASMALGVDGSIFTWGSNNSGQLGSGRSRSQLTPVPMTALSGFQSISVGQAQVAVRLSDNRIFAWGNNLSGQIGQGGSGAELVYSLPQEIANVKGAQTLAMGDSHTLALMQDGRVMGWGSNASGELNDEQVTHRDTPAPVPGLANITALAAGGSYSLFLDQQRRVWWCGHLTDTIMSKTASLLDGVTDVKSISTGSKHALALTRDGKVWVWGDNQHEQLGIPSDTKESATPLLVMGLPKVAAISAGARGSLALDVDGRVWMLGGASLLSQVAGLEGVKAIACGALHFLALKNDGTVWSWGSNYVGALGDGTRTPRDVPAQVPGLKRVTHIFAGWYFSMALTPDALYVWGDDEFGQLGLGGMLYSLTPYQVPNFKLW